MKQARLSAQEAIGTAGYEQKLQRLISEGRFIHPLDGDRPSFADLAHALARSGWLGFHDSIVSWFAAPRTKSFRDALL